MKRTDKGLPLINIGFGNVVSASHVIAIVAPGSSPIKRLREEAVERGKLVDATQGRKTRAIIVTDSDHVILSALQVETLTQRCSEE
jgi:extracellular matrix regulatory protein A